MNRRTLIKNLLAAPFVAKAVVAAATEPEVVKPWLTPGEFVISNPQKSNYNKIRIDFNAGESLRIGGFMGREEWERTYPKFRWPEEIERRSR